VVDGQAVIITERTRERSAKARFTHDARVEPRRAYSYERAGHLWTPKRKRLDCIGGGPCGSFAARGAGADDSWQPTSVAGFALDIDPKRQLTTGLDGARVTTATVVNNAPSATDPFTNANPSLQPTYEPLGWGGSYLRPSILFNGASYYLVCTSSLATTLAGGTDTPFSLFWVAEQITTTGTQNHLGFFRTSNAQPIWDLFTSAGAYTSLRRDNATVNVSVSGGTASTGRHIYEAIYSGTSLLFKIDGVTVINNVSQDVGVITFDAMVLGATYAAASPNNWANIRLGRVNGFTGALNSTDAGYVRSSLTAIHF
jgi:hypothetical protein